MNTKRYYVVKATKYGLKYYCGDDKWMYSKFKAKKYLSEKEAYEAKFGIKPENHLIGIL